MHYVSINIGTQVKLTLIIMLAVTVLLLLYKHQAIPSTMIVQLLNVQFVILKLL